MIADGSVEVLIIAPISDAALHTVQAVDAAVRVVDGRQMFEAEYRRSWPPATARRYLPAKAGPREALPQAERDRLLATAEVARLCEAVGMGVVGTRRRVAAGEPAPEGVSRLESPDRLHALLGESDFVAVCCQLTAETEGLINRAAIAAMKPGAVVINVARGEIIDETALREGLATGQIGGAALDVYRGEFEGDPDRGLWDDPRVLITPHVSGETDVNLHRGMDLFCDNLRRYLNGQPLENVVGWGRGY